MATVNKIAQDLQGRRNKLLLINKHNSTIFKRMIFRIRLLHPDNKIRKELETNKQIILKTTNFYSKIILNWRFNGGRCYNRIIIIIWAIITFFVNNKIILIYSIINIPKIKKLQPQILWNNNNFRQVVKVKYENSKICMKCNRQHLFCLIRPSLLLRFLMIKLTKTILI